MAEFIVAVLVIIGSCMLAAAQMKLFAIHREMVQLNRTLSAIATRFQAEPQSETVPVQVPLEQEVIHVSGSKVAVVCGICAIIAIVVYILTLAIK